MDGYIYKITFNGTNKFYIGSTINFKRRKMCHIYNLRNGIANRKMQNTYNKYGESNIEFEILEKIQVNDRNELYDIEGKYFDIFFEKSDSNSKIFNSNSLNVSVNPYTPSGDEALSKYSIICWNDMSEYSGVYEVVNLYDISKNSVYANLNNKESKAHVKNLVFFKTTDELNEYIDKYKTVDNYLLECISIHKHRISSCQLGKKYEGDRLIQHIQHLNNIRTVKSVLQYDIDGNLISEFPSIRTASKYTGINHSKISAVCKGKRNTTGGYVWKYKKIN